MRPTVSGSQENWAFCRPKGTLNQRPCQKALPSSNQQPGNTASQPIINKGSLMPPKLANQGLQHHRPHQLTNCFSCCLGPADTKGACGCGP